MENRGKNVQAVVCTVAVGAALLLLSTTTPSAALAPTAAGPPTPAAAVPTATITIANFQFQPAVVALDQGGTLTVTNNDGFPHSFTSDAVDGADNPLFDVKIPAGASRTITAVSALGNGTYGFHCRFHPEMTGTLTVGTGGPVPTHVPAFEQPLVQPPRLSGKHLRIVMRKQKVRVLPHGPRTPMWTYGGSFPGPTIVRRTGRDTRVTFVNHLPRKVGAVTVHQHGGHQAAKYDGQPMDHLIRHGHRMTYDYPLVDAGKPLPAALRFYHDHRMGRTARNNWFGLQGMFLTTDPGDARRGLPHGRFDLPLMFTDRSFTQDNRLRNPFRKMSMPMPAARSMPPMAGMSGLAATDPSTLPSVGTKVLVNGRYAPYKYVEPGRYRLQILNASPFSSYDFSLSDGRPFVQIGTGSGLLPAPVTRQDILLGPAQRADVVVDFRHLEGTDVLLSSIPRTDGSTTGIGTRDAALMQFRVRGTTRQTARVPATLATIAPMRIPHHVAMTWTFGVSHDRHGAYWSINGKRYDPTRVDHRVTLGSTELWRLRNTSDLTHYVHLHEELWRTVSRDGRRPPPWERGYEDTWRLDPGETVLVAARFTDFTGDFMVHCHMLDHEDDAMMATFRVVPKKG
ncbi:multicopper oxidase domain-containing protein [Nocardioides cynanchi]|uniref:multicopper oxidase domain-containing protein n=1 Tax=Nocardioides cynanchi TaxID=2558918 RepID=UPI001244A831|nr:multicopper oxidase domain-containing protein [Nocardioides cynanchi]